MFDDKPKSKFEAVPSGRIDGIPPAGDRNSQENYNDGDIAEIEGMFGIRNVKNQFLLKRGWGD